MGAGIAVDESLSSAGVATPRLRVALVDMVLNRHEGGMATALATLVDALKDHCDITVFCATADEEFHSAVRVVELPAIPAHRFLLFFVSFSASWSIARRWFAVRERFDIVHCNSPLFAGWDIASVHFCSAAYLSSGSLALSGAHGWRDRVRRLYGRIIHGLVARLESLVYRRFARSTWQTLLPVSDGLRGALEEQFQIGDRIHVVPNAIDVSRYQQGPASAFRQALLSRASWSSESFLCLFVGAGDWQRKGLDRAIKSLAFLPDTVKLVVVGRGDVPTFSGIAEQAGVSGRVLFAGFSTNVADYYRASDAFVFPSRYEAMPMVGLEAMACGLPIVGTAFHGSESYLRDGINGLLTDGEPRDVATMIETLRADVSLRAVMSKNARETALQFSRDQVSARVLEEYRRVALEKARNADS